MKSVRFSLALILFGVVFNVCAKEATSSGASKRFADTLKREQRDVIRELDPEWKRYLRWHRDAMVLREREDGANAGSRQPFLQL